MRIQVLYVPGCPNHEAAISSVNEVLRAEKMVAVVEEVEVSDAAAAQTLRFPGSPTIRINGVDAEPNEELFFGLACRLYSSASHVPSQTTLRSSNKTLRAGRTPPFTHSDNGVQLRQKYDDQSIRESRESQSSNAKWIKSDRKSVV